MARFKVTFHKQLEHRLTTNPVFFLRLDAYSYIDRNGNEVDESKWISVDHDLNISLEAKHYKITRRNYHLCIVELDSRQPRQDERGNIVADEYDYFVHTATAQNENDLITLFKLYTYHMQRPEKDYACVELLWLLNVESFINPPIQSALSRVEQNTARWVCCGLVDFGRSLSVLKQQQLRSIVAAYGYTFRVYEPSYIQDALTRINADWHYSNSNKNVFQAVDTILNSEIAINTKQARGNMLLELLKWFDNSEPFSDYSHLVNLYALVDEPVRLKMLKRWFHDIRLGHTTFDQELLEQFKDNRFAKFIRYRHCMEHPCEPILLTVPLLADNILTLYSSNGMNFQSFDGVLDFAITHCDTSHPAIDFKMDRFLPICDGGTQRNSEFVGFVDYALIRKLDESKLTERYVLPIIQNLLDNFAQRKPYTACQWDTTVPLNAEQLQHCLKARSLPQADSGAFNRPTTWRLKCAITCHYKDRWLVKNCNNFDFNVLLKDGVQVDDMVQTEVDLSMLSPTKFIEFLRLIPTRFEELGNGEFLVPSYRQRTLLMQLVEEFSTIERMRVMPNKTVYAGLSFDIFGIRRRMLEEHGYSDQLHRITLSQLEELNERYAGLEAKEVFARILKSLKTNYNLGIFNEEENFFETKFDRNVLIEIIRKYYYRQSITERTIKNNLNFLESKITPRYPLFCSPSLAEARNEILDFPYFWCRGNECFHNCLGKQTLAEMNNWENYSMFHLIEIIGYPKLQKTEAGYEPKTEVIQFIAVTNKAMQKFRRLKCRDCGHLLFTDRSSGYNRNNYYACVNPNCAEYHRPVYLSYCFQCKKGLIDSRDSAQCPNGWYICPSCLSCCDDAQYERQAQRYILEHKPVPLRIQQKLGKGHNNKGIHYCPTCGTQIILYQDNHGDFHKGCPQCREIYNI